MACCPDVWYCTNGVVTTQAVGTAAPVGYTGGPWATEAEAIAGCALPAVSDVTLAGCCAGNVTLPGKVYLTLTSITGWLIGRLPNSVPVVIDPGTLRGGATLSFTDGLGGSCYGFVVSVVAACDVGMDRWGVNVEFGTSIGCGCVAGSGSVVAPWTSYGSGSGTAGFSQKFACPNSWALPGAESVGTASFTCTAGTGSFVVTVSR